MREGGCHEQVAKLGPVSRAAGMDCECLLYIYSNRENQKPDRRFTMTEINNDTNQTPHKRRVRYSGTHPRSYKEKYKELNSKKYR